MASKALKTAIVFLFVLFPFYSVLAVESLSVVINEIAWMGTEVEDAESKSWWRYEWIELFNTTNKEIDISGWQIENAKSKNETLTILAAKIPTKGYFLICRKKISDCDLIESKLSLHNEYNKNDKLVLKDAAGKIIDATPEANDKQWTAGDNEIKQTMERKDALISGNDSSNWQTSQNPGGTPGVENSAIAFQPLGEMPPETELEPEPVFYPSNIFINELLPSPEGADAENEWIELFNGNNFEVALAGWQIRDTIGATKTYTIPEGTKIGSNGFLILFRTETKITLQNSGDSLELLNPKGEIIDKTNYPKAPLGQSFNRTSTGWFWSTTLTSGEINVIAEPELPKSEPSGGLIEKRDQTNLSQLSQAKGDGRILAKISEELPKSSSSLVIFFVALSIAISSAIIVLFLKKRMEAEEQL